MNFEEIVLYLTTKQAITIYAIIALSAFIENVFPPYPSDTIILAGAFMAGTGELAYFPLFFAAMAGGLAGAMLLYFLGYTRGRSFFYKYDRSYFKIDNMAKIERWFGRWGDYVLIISRFMAGVRSIVAITAGIGKVPVYRMTLFSLLSFFLWYLMLIGGMFLIKSNWEKLVGFINSLNIFLVIISAAVLMVWLVIFYLKSRKKK